MNGLVIALLEVEVIDSYNPRSKGSAGTDWALLTGI